MRDAVRALQDRTGGADRDRGVALLTALLMIMIMSALSVLVLGLVVSQVKPTHFSEKSTRTIFAAEAGVEASLARIRTAVAVADFTGNVYGDPKKLPCTLTGAVDTAASGTTYDVTIQYFKEDPAGRSAGWRATNALPCSNGLGTNAQLPSYAYISSHGQAVSSARVKSDMADRSIAMIYQFSTTTTNVAGGRIYSYVANSSTAQFCLRAEGLTDGSTIKYRPVGTCGTNALEDYELWIYDTDYTIKLASSTLTANTLCLTTIGSDIKLKSCASPTYEQLWSWHEAGKATWQGQDSGKADSGRCLGSPKTSGTPGDGDLLKLTSGCADNQPYGSFSPDPAVGPGAASVNTHQIVNYLEFGRCFDVTDETTSRPFLISYPCKQDPPAGAALKWNHKWFYNEPLVGTTAPKQLIYIYNAAGTQYCLQSPAAQSTPSGYAGIGVGFYPVITTSCNLATPASQWIRHTATGNKTTSWTIQDSTGRCVAASGGRYNGNWTSLVMATCDGSTAQKWNAPAENVEAEVGNYLEETS
ncbi:RICIN domain-containing protein [Cellulomonas fengjieae]|uniref:RICIN domain-containing protein n=1 Tax=Cellulomonas fengjieae TaxID=2819978 RepID=UPI001AAF78FD|nr:RICIN domain-containing protein [Cellulomonas fengjieae]MBO3102655.1 RICIN domain-containing protein [Cellulomonas fengjieae]